MQNPPPRLWSRLAPPLGVALLTGLAGLTGCPNLDLEPSTDNPSYPNVLALAPTPLSTPNPAVAHTSGRALAVTEDAVFVVDAGNGALVVMDRETMEVRRTVPVGTKPEQVVVDPSGTAFVTVRDSGEVVRIPRGSATVDARVRVGIEPWGLARHPQHDILYVSDGARGEVFVLDATTLEVTATVPVAEGIEHPAPRGLAARVTELVVTHQFGQISRVPLMAGMPSVDPLVADLRAGGPADNQLFEARKPRIRPTHALAAAAHPHGSEVYVVHAQVTPGDEDDLRAMAQGLNANPSAPPPVPQYYGPEMQAETWGTPLRPVEVGISMVNNSLYAGRPPVADPMTGEPMTHLISDPSDINHHPSWSMLFVTGFGSDNVVVFNTAYGDPMASPIAEFKVGQAPKAVAFSPDGTLGYVLNAHDYTVSTLVLSPLFEMPASEPRPALGVKDSAASRGGSAFGNNVDFIEDNFAEVGQHVVPFNLTHRDSASFGIDPLSEELKRGRRVFTFARNDRLSRMGHFSCNTCHFEGREDKLTWVVTQGPRQTPALAGRLHDSAPFNWNGTKDHLQTNMTRTVSRMGGTGLTDDEKNDLEKFMLQGFDEPKNPHIAAAGELTPEQQLGMDLFFGEAGCGTCHVGGDSVDTLNHSVGTLTDPEVEAHAALQERGEAEVTDPSKFNTPSLRGLFYTAPYLHDGSAATLREALLMTEGRMGHIQELTSDEIDALVAYMNTL